MADYRHAINIVLQTEGGYTNDANDAGGETYMGISRKFWPNWSGWVIVDICKKDSKNFPKNLKSNTTLTDLVIGLYKNNFWNNIGGDGISDQTIANLLIDSAVNEGIKPAIKRAQSIVGLNQTGIITPELVSKLNSMI